MIAGALVAGGFEWACYGADSLSFFASAVFIWGTICRSELAGTSEADPAGLRHDRIIRDLRDTVRVSFTRAPIRAAMLSMALGVFATGCFSGLLPIYVRDLMHTGPSTYGVLGSLIAAGALAGSLAFARYARMEAPNRWLRAGLCTVGVMITLLAAFPARFVVYAAFGTIGASAAVAMTAAATILQREAPDGMRGRVSAVSASLTSLAQLAAIACAGAAEGWIGIRGVYAISGTLLLLPLAFQYSHR